MVASNFTKFIAQAFPGIVLKTTNTINNLEGEQRYYFQDYLDTRYSVDGKWTSLSANNKSLRADIVSMDSSLPLKSRGSLGRATGDIFKLGQRYQMREQELTELDTLIATGQMDIAIQRFFEDTPKVIRSIPEMIESMFLELASTGVSLVTSEDGTVGTGVRIDAGVPSLNRFGSTFPWGTTQALPLTDIRKILSKVETDGKKVIRLLMNRASYNALKSSSEGKAFFAISVGNFGTTFLEPNSQMFLSAFRDEFGCDIQIIERSVTYQRDDVDTVYVPWKVGAVTAITSTNLGSNVWAKLAEMNHPVAGVAYQTANQHTLVSKYRKNEPALAEVTTSQARVCPVLNNVEGIYMLDSTLTTP